MANQFVDELNSRISRLDLDFSGKIQVKQFFGGAAAYYEDKIFLTLTKVGTAIKLSVKDLNDLEKMGGGEVRYFPKGHIKKEYRTIPPLKKNDKEFLEEWIMRSIRFIETGSVK